MAGDENDAEANRARLAERLINAEREERRRIALFLHNGPVQSLSGIALMLDTARKALDEGRVEDARRVIDAALARHRDAIRALRDLSFNLEPVVLRDQGFAPAVRALSETLGISEEIRIDLDVAAGDELAEEAQVTLYQIVREALDQAVRRGPPSRVAIRVTDLPDGSVEAEVVDDGSGERRRASIDAIEERAAPMNGRVSIEAVEGGGTRVRVTLPPYTARR